MHNKNYILVLSLLFIIVFIDQIGNLLIIPLLPFLLHDINHVDIVNNSVLAAYILASYSFMQFIFSPIMGALSDKYGRKVILIFCLTFFAIDYLIMASAHSIWILFIGRLLAGVPGSSISVAFASVSDFSDENNKVKNYGIVLAAIGLGLIVGPLFGGILADSVSLRAPFWIASLFCVLNIVICLKFLPETLPKDKRKFLGIKNPITSIIKIGQYAGIKEMQISQFFITVAFQAPVVLWSFYGKSRLDWTLHQITLSLSFLGLVYTLVQSILVRYSYNLLGDKKSIILGASLYALGTILMSFAYDNFNMYLALFVFSLGSIASSSVMNIFSKAIPKNEQGELQGVITSINSLCAIITPPIMAKLYDIGLKNNLILKDSLPFVFATCLFLLSIPFYHMAFKKINLKK